MNTKLTTLLLVVVLIPLLSFSQTDFSVPAGEQRTLTATERSLSLKTFSLGDNCTIVIPPSMDGWTVTAAEATIGTNVTIMGQAVNGTPGPAGATASNGSSCMAGYNGSSGTIGSNGASGKNISLNLRIKDIGSLTIIANGGIGGNGGPGGRGGNGGNATCTCSGGNGGSGGNGARGGNGGNGGNVSVYYSKVGNADVSNSNFVIRNTGGPGGMGGPAGYGGAGGAVGACTDPKAAVQRAGAMGTYGMSGPPGLPGTKGTTILQTK